MRYYVHSKQAGAAIVVTGAFADHGNYPSDNFCVVHAGGCATTAHAAAIVVSLGMDLATLAKRTQVSI